MRRCRIILIGIMCLVMIFGVSYAKTVGENFSPDPTELSHSVFVLELQQSSSWQKDGRVYYPITTDSEHWKALKTTSDMHQVCEIPKDLIEGSTTSELLELVLDYPLLTDILLYDSYDQGIRALTENFNGAAALFAREDMRDVVFNKYTKSMLYCHEKLDVVSDENKIISSAKSVLIEYYLAHEIVNGNFSMEKINILYKEAEENMEEKMTDSILSSVANVFYDEIHKSISTTVIPAGDNKTPLSRLVVKTPKGSSVTVTTPTFNGIDWANALTQDTRRKYPNATVKFLADNRYNCHSYAWYWANISNRYWMNSPSAYVNDKSYQYIGSKPTANGQKVAWVTIPFSNPYVHSGIVTNATSRTVISKWGQGPLMQHNVSYSPYTSNSINYYK